MKNQKPKLTLNQESLRKLTLAEFSSPVTISQNDTCLCAPSRIETTCCPEL